MKYASDWFGDELNVFDFFCDDPNGVSVTEWDQNDMARFKVELRGIG